MKKSIGMKLTELGELVLYLGIGVSVGSGVVMAVEGDLFTIIGICVIIGGVISSVVVSYLLRGVGEIADNSAVIARACCKKNAKEESVACPYEKYDEKNGIHRRIETLMSLREREVLTTSDVIGKLEEMCRELDGIDKEAERYKALCYEDEMMSEEEYMRALALLCQEWEAARW